MTRAVTQPTEHRDLPAEVYARVFENFPDGKLVLEDLVRKFGRSIYVKGGLEGDRATCKNAGNREVLDFILGKINQAAGLSEPAPTED